MKLYECTPRSFVRILDSEPRVPIGATPVKTNQTIRFHHIDGMYSFCHTNDGKLVHPVAWSEVEPIDSEWES